MTLGVLNVTKAVLETKQSWRKQELKEAYEVNKTQIRDDQAPIIRVDCKINKHWKQVEKVTLDGGARVNGVSE